MRVFFLQFTFLFTKKKSPRGYTIDPNNKCIYTNLYRIYFIFFISHLPFYFDGIQALFFFLYTFVPIALPSCKMFFFWYAKSIGLTIISPSYMYTTLKGILI